MSLTQITDHVARGKALNIEWFKGKPNWEGLLEVFLEELQEVEDVLWALLTDRWIDTATDAQLDQVGAILEEPRNGNDDDTYRTLIRVKALLLTSKGEPERIMQIVKLATDSTLVHTVDEWPAGFRIWFNGTPAPLYDEKLKRLVARARLGGVKAMLFAGEAPSFMVGSSHVAASVNAGVWEGIGSSHFPGDGGKISRVVTTMTAP
jgi:hypothetical protein